MKKLLLLLIIGCAATAWGKPVENEMYFRAMKDEMNRTLRELRLPGEVKPFYVAYWVNELTNFQRGASLGSLLAVTPEEHRVLVQGVVEVGSEADSSRGFARSEEQDMPRWWVPVSYEGLRMGLWKLSDKLYLDSVERYKQKKAYLRKKNMQDKLPDFVPVKSGVFIEEITPWQVPDSVALETWLKKVSGWGKEIAFVEDFVVVGYASKNDRYFLNSRGGKSQTEYTEHSVLVYAEFRQPDGYKETKQQRFYVRDLSREELTRAESKIRTFLDTVQTQYGAKTGEAYVGPVLYKPSSAADFLRVLLLGKLSRTVPFLVEDSDEDLQASPWRKKLGQRILSPGIAIYDRPQATEFEGISLENKEIDLEGVPTQELVLVSNGRLQELPLGQRPLDKKHASNGHAFFADQIAPREGLSNVFVESETQLTDEQMEEKLLERCRELELEYCYIQHSFGDFERIYSKDGHKERIVGLEDANLSARSLRDIEVAGGKPQLSRGRLDIITPSLLINEVEVIPQDRKPGRKPFVTKP